MSNTNTQPPAAGEAAHTPTPWRIVEIDNSLRGPIQFIVADGQHGKVRVFVADAGFDFDSAPTRDICKANAAFIVRACNAYDTNQRTIAELTKTLELQVSRLEWVAANGIPENIGWWNVMADDMRAALARAKEASK